MKIKNSTKTKQEIIDTLYEEIERKDKIIERLKEENAVLMRTAVKANEKLNLLEEKLRGNQKNI